MPDAWNVCPSLKSCHCCLLPVAVDSSSSLSLSLSLRFSSWRSNRSTDHRTVSPRNSLRCVFLSCLPHRMTHLRHIWLVDTSDWAESHMSWRFLAGDSLQYLSDRGYLHPSPLPGSVRFSYSLLVLKMTTEWQSLRFSPRQTCARHCGGYYFHFHMSGRWIFAPSHHYFSLLHIKIPVNPSIHKAKQFSSSLESTKHIIII